ncbi:hypothetical protein SEA_BIANCATRI92_38 [Mycobacterium phage BiancaTri92]|nr:hypothetical protein SEA_BIANCATRI92_38 [Mycobacterium phage BiancaTri92]
MYLELHILGYNLEIKARKKAHRVPKVIFVSDQETQETIAEVAHWLD